MTIYITSGNVEINVFNDINDSKILKDFKNAIKTLYYKKDMILFCKKHISNFINLNDLSSEFIANQFISLKNLNEQDINNVYFKNMYINLEYRIFFIISIDRKDILINLYFPLQKRNLKKFKKLSYKILTDKNTVIFPLIKEEYVKRSPVNKAYLYVTQLDDIYEVNKWISTLNGKIYIEFNKSLLYQRYYFYIRETKFNKFLKRLKNVNSDIYDRIRLDMLVRN